MKIITTLCLVLCLGVSANAQTRENRNVSSFKKLVFRAPGKLYLRQGSEQKVEIEGKKEILAKIETNVEGSKLIIEPEDDRWRWSRGDEITVYVTMTDVEGISVGGSGNIIGETTIKGDDIDLNVSGSGNMKIKINASGDLESDVSGSGNIDLEGRCESFNSDVSGSGKVLAKITADGKADFGVSGSGKIEASGSAHAVKANISGSGKVMAADLETNSCDVSITGSGDVEINVKNEINANIVGSGSVRYRGNPNKVHSNSTGSGSLKKL